MRYIFGFGNYIKGDDSIGIRIVEHIILSGLEKNFKAIEIVNNGMLFLTYFQEKLEKILIIDSAEINKKPGEYLLFKPEDIKTKKIISNISTHEGDVIKLIKIAEKLNYSIPEIKILGIQPKQFNVDTPLSLELKNNFNTYIEVAIDEILK